jgi:hypothetical protein
VLKLRSGVIRAEGARHSPRARQNSECHKKR